MLGRLSEQRSFARVHLDQLKMCEMAHLLSYSSKRPLNIGGQAPSAHGRGSTFFSARGEVDFF